MRNKTTFVILILVLCSALVIGSTPSDSFQVIDESTWTEPIGEDVNGDCVPVPPIEPGASSTLSSTGSGLLPGGTW